MVLKVKIMAAFKEKKEGRVIGRGKVGNLQNASYALFFFNVGDSNCENSPSWTRMTSAVFLYVTFKKGFSNI